MLANQLLSMHPSDEKSCWSTSSPAQQHSVNCVTLENGNMEEVHVIKDAAIFKIDDELTHRRASLNNLHRIMDSEENLPGLLKLYLHNS
jgi:hypothetical protein